MPKGVSSLLSNIQLPEKMVNETGFQKNMVNAIWVSKYSLCNLGFKIWSMKKW